MLPAMNITNLLSRIGFTFTHGRNGTFLRLPLLGLWLAFNPWGNCFAPAIIAKTTRFTRNGRWQRVIVLTLRTRSHTETSFYWSSPCSVRWNSAHIAQWFGKHFQPDCENPMEVDRHEYTGSLGRHIAL
jgi:hypothetical protein